MNIENDIQEISHYLAKITRWAERQSNVKGITRVGSYARNTATEKSDLDLVILSDTPNCYLSDKTWLNQFGIVKDLKRIRYGKITSLHVEYTVQPKIEFSFATPDWISTPPDKNTFKVIMDGIRVIYDPEQLFSQFIAFIIEHSPAITFRLATIKDRALIKHWWTKPHVVEFWDNSPEMWQNVENYFQGKKDLFDYWIGFFGKTPFSLIMTSDIDKAIPPTDIYYPWLEPHGLTKTIDFMIGEKTFLGKGLSYRTLRKFAEFLRASGVCALIIDPAVTNQKAVYAYQKAGFEIVATFTRTSGYFAGVKHYLMKMKL